jgi:hypothetical protein
MINADPFCVRCKSPMEEGLMLDHADGGANLQAEWMEGEPEIRKFLGFISFGRVNIKDKKILKVSVWRCPRCGVLESYAH